MIVDGCGVEVEVEFAIRKGSEEANENSKSFGLLLGKGV